MTMFGVSALQILVILLSVVSIGVFLWNLSVNRSLEAIPVFGWAVFMLIPFALAWPYYPDPYRELHAIGILIIGLPLLVVDLWAIKTTGLVEPKKLQSNIVYVAAASLAISLILMLYHVVVNPNIPLFAEIRQFLSGQTTENSIFNLRYEFNRTEMPSFLRYATNFNIHIFGVLSVVLFWLSGKRFLSAAVLICIVFYALLSSGQWPIVTLTLGLGIQFLSRQLKKSQYTGAIFSIVVVMGLGYVTQYSLGKSAEADFSNEYRVDAIVQNLPESDPRRYFSPSDYLRLPLEFRSEIYSRDYAGAPVQIPAEIPAEIPAKIPAEKTNVTPGEFLINLYIGVHHRLYYRVFLTPVDVSDRWYQYFTYAHSDPLPISNLVSRGRGAGALSSTHPAVAVSGWAWGERFQEDVYFKSHASSSVDADAFAYGGIPAVLVAGILLAVFRFSFAFFRVGSQLGHTLYMIGMTAFFLFPSSGSLPALLVPNGMLLVWFLMLVLWVYDKTSSLAE